MNAKFFQDVSLSLVARDLVDIVQFSSSWSSLLLS